MNSNENVIKTIFNFEEYNNKNTNVYEKYNKKEW